MKLFSRKALAAVATTVALTTAGLSAPAFAEPDASSAIGVAHDDEGKTGSDDKAEGSPAPGEGEGEGSPAPGEGEGEGSPAPGKGEGKGSSLDTSDPKSITAWVGVFTAIISALSAAFVFIQRITA